MKFDDSNELARRIRLHAVRMVNRNEGSHIGSVLSVADIIAVLYGAVMQYDPTNPQWKDRDRFILSKGHAGAAVYAALAECGFFSVDLLTQHCEDGSKLSGHVSHKDIPGVELSTGSLGHGLPVACGMAYAAKIAEKKHRIFVVLSDGELDEGSNWEALLFAAHHKLNNITVVVDRNRLQSMDSTENTLKLEPLAEKINAFGWLVDEVDGHDHMGITQSLTSRSDKPHLVIAETIKGKGVSFMENQVCWHYKTPKDELFDQAITELGGQQ